MKNEKQDLRIVKTKKVLYMALVDLMREKTFEEIKVSEICSRALVNRSTFYAHYEDKYEFLVDFLDTFKDSLTSYLDTNDNNLNTKEYYMEMLKLLLTHIEDKKNIYSAIMVNNRNGVMMGIISDVVNKDIKKRVQESGLNKGTIPVDIVAKFYIGAITLSVFSSKLYNPDIKRAVSILVKNCPYFLRSFFGIPSIYSFVSSIIFSNIFHLPTSLLFLVIIL